MRVVKSIMDLPSTQRTAALYGKLQIAQSALERIAAADYRGNRQNESLEAEKALREIEEWDERFGI